MLFCFSGSDFSVERYKITLSLPIWIPFVLVIFTIMALLTYLNKHASKVTGSELDLLKNNALRLLWDCRLTLDLSRGFANEIFFCKRAVNLLKNAPKWLPFKLSCKPLAN